MTRDGEHDYGFHWGPMSVVRYAAVYISPHRFKRALGIEINGHPRLEVYVSPTGKSVRVFDKKLGRELK